MPVLDGYETTKEIRKLEQERKAKKRVPIVALTGKEREEGRRREGGGKEEGRRREGGGKEEGRRREGGGKEEGRRREGGGKEEGRRREGGGKEEGRVTLLMHIQHLPCLRKEREA